MVAAALKQAQLMEIDTPIKALAPHRQGCCPDCGTPYPSGESDVGCPVCQFRRLLRSEVREPDEGLFDHYELVLTNEGTFEELGRGGMGITYKAIDTVLGQTVALKVIDPRIASYPEVRKRFLREAQVAARLWHPNVASVFYYGVRERDGQCFYAMELVKGETLEARLRRAGPLSITAALQIVAQVAAALAAAQPEGLVHRDLKPSNLMLSDGPELTVKLIDFGFAKISTIARDAELSDGGFVGTPAFASPEQCTGGEVDIRSDLYSLGIILWEMVTDHQPFRGSSAEVKHQHQHAALPLEQLEGVPQPIILLIQALLTKDAARRLQTPSEVLKVVPAISEAVEAGRTVAYESLRKMLAGDSTAITPKSSQKPEVKNISTARLPITGRDVFGREEDIAFLDNAWTNQDVNLVTIIGWAGIGKSALVNHWLRSMAIQRYRFAEVVFGWSFYKQGSSGGTSSADEFIDAALSWFGDPHPHVGTGWEKGERLAKLVARRRTLLILDGLEPLQNPPGPQEGRLRETSLQAFLRELAAFNSGLGVITSRLPIADIANYEGTSVARRDLEQLSHEAGAKLLRALGVTGDENDLRNASNEFRGHCLALTLLGNYLVDAYDGDIRHRKALSGHLASDMRQGGHARKVMESYRAWFGEGPQLSILRILGLFDRPAEKQAISAILKPPVIAGVTGSLSNLSPAEWRTAITELRRSGLLSGKDPDNPAHLDAHPLVREYFGEQLRTQHTGAWKECNKRLYHYYQTIAPALPDNVRQMEPLFLGVICGCNAGLLRQALHDVYIARIQRGNASFAANVLGARGALLSVLAQFFENGRWDSPVKYGVEGQDLTAEDQLFVLMQAGLYLTATAGHSTAEVHICYERAERLCHFLHRAAELFASLMGQWRYSLLTAKLTTTTQIAKRAYSLAREQNDAALLMGAFRILAVTHYFSGNFKIAQRHAKRGIQLWQAGDIQPRFEEVNSPVVVCLSFDALCAWHFGEVTFCHTITAQAISLAKKLNDTYASAVALFHAAFAAHFEANVAEVERLALELVDLATRQHFSQWLAAGKVFGGWAHSACGSPADGVASIEEGIREWKAPGSTLVVPYWLALKAEALQFAGRPSEALDGVQEAEALAKASGELWWLAELYRLQGVFLSRLEESNDEIEEAFCKALSTAKQQESISLTARAAASYAKFRSQKANV